ncbi:hypothetical protein FOBRF1_000489 [Fusarium oxysporum]
MPGLWACRGASQNDRVFSTFIGCFPVPVREVPGHQHIRSRDSKRARQGTARLVSNISLTDYGKQKSLITEARSTEYQRPPTKACGIT